MHITKQDVQLITCTNDLSYTLEIAARTCTNTVERTYKDPDFLKNSIMKRKHYSVLEHVTLTFRFTTSRAIANQIVRHRMAAYCQESMRYVKLNRKLGGVPVIAPYGYDGWSDDAKAIWYDSVKTSEDTYEALLAMKIKAEDARGVLPLDTATVLTATWNLRELFHILYHPVSGRLTNKHAQPKIRELFSMVESVLQDELPFVYELAQIYKQNESTPQANSSAN